MLTFCVCTLALFGQIPASEELWRLPAVNDEIVAAAAPDFFPRGQLLETAEEVDESHLDDGPLIAPPHRFTSTWIAPGGSQGFGTFDLDYNRTWQLSTGRERPPLAVTPGVGMHLWSGPTDLDLPSRVFDLYLDVSWRPLEHDSGGIAIGVTPGFYGDFENLDGNAFQLTGWGLANHRFGPHWNIVGGVAVVRQLKSRLLPIGGVIWTPSEDTRLELLFPRPRVARRLWRKDKSEAWCYLGGQFGGGAWSVADTPTENVLVSYSDLRLLWGVETQSLHGYDLSLEAGYVFSRDISVNQTSLLAPDPTFLLQCSVAF